METSINGARGVLINITGSEDMGLEDVEAAANLVQEAAHPDANIIFGATFDPSMQDEIRVTVIATGFRVSSVTDAPAQGRSPQRVSGRRPGPGPAQARLVLLEVGSHCPLPMAWPAPLPEASREDPRPPCLSRAASTCLQQSRGRSP